MKLVIPYINNTDFNELDSLLKEKGSKGIIDNANWEDFKYKPEVQFFIAHSGKAILLTYCVREKFIKALETKLNGDVYKDSTVEFFISLDNKNYYNFEFSCIGVAHVGYGSSRKGRVPVSPDTIQKIKIHSTLGNQPFEEKQGDFYWEMTIEIPIECFVFDKIESLEGICATANFYKCGDETSEPHYISWNPIKTETPDYHRPEFFAAIEFEKK